MHILFLLIPLNQFLSWKNIKTTMPKSPTKRDSDESIRTSPTLRAKGKAISRCFISIIKLFRLCKKSKKEHKNV